MAVKKGGLGRGLDSLFSENSADSAGSVELKISEIEPNREQPRREFDEETIESLAQSISEYGVLQPIVVRPQGNTYQIVAGERRFRAALKAGVSTVPVVIKELDDKTVAELALIENIQREDLNPVDEAEAFRRLSEVYGLSQEQIAAKVGRSRPSVANSLRLLELDGKSLELVRTGKISGSAARTLLSAPDSVTLSRMREAALYGASIRELERMAKAAKKSEKVTPPAPAAKPPYYKEVEISLTDELHRRVKVAKNGSKGGTISFEFYSDEDLQQFVKRFV